MARPVLSRLPFVLADLVASLRVMAEGDPGAALSLAEPFYSEAVRSLADHHSRQVLADASGSMPSPCRFGGILLVRK